MRDDRILGVLVPAPRIETRWGSRSSIQMRTGRPREGKRLAQVCTGCVVELGSDPTCPVSQANTLSTQDAAGGAGSRLSPREVLERRRGKRFDRRETVLRAFNAPRRASGAPHPCSLTSSLLCPHPPPSVVCSTSRRTGCVIGRVTAPRYWDGSKCHLL